MPRNIFLSFLGVSAYEPVSYYLQRKPKLTEPQCYVQLSLLDTLAPGFGPEDAAYVFLTDEARTSNWQDDGHTNFRTGESIPNAGLATLIGGRQFPFPVYDISIDGESEEKAIWTTFQTVFGCLQEGDRVYLDITHSWRYLPMLGMTLLNYAKALKRIEVRAIYYGALEQLGKSYEVKNMPLEERPVPILNLVSFSDLQDWTVAADDFVRNGNPERLSLLTHKNLNPILKQSQGKDIVARNLSDITKRLHHLTALLATNRGRGIWDFNYQALHGALDAFSVEQSHIKPLTGVVDHIRGKVSGFDALGHLQWLQGVQWCISHGLVQQGLTQLQEGILSWLCLYFEQKEWAEPAYFDRHKRDGRNLLSATLQFILSAPPEHEWTGEVARRRELVYRIMEDPAALQLAKVFRKLSATRNDINHGGYTNDTKAEQFFNVLKECYGTIRAIVEDLRPDQPAETVGLLNVSNHPFENWPKNQIEQARAQFGRINDLPFPNIDPQMETDKLHDLVSRYFEKILQFQPAAVHLMGEMTFTFALVQKLKAAGIPCIASTTERLVVEKDGKKTVEFQFVQFRPY